MWYVCMILIVNILVGWQRCIFLHEIRNGEICIENVEIINFFRESIC